MKIVESRGSSTEPYGSLRETTFLETFFRSVYESVLNPIAYKTLKPVKSGTFNTIMF